jgi:hypothetical protein
LSVIQTQSKVERTILNHDECAEQADLHTKSSLQLRRSVRNQLEWHLGFFLGVVHQQALAIGGDVKGTPIPGETAWNRRWGVPTSISYPFKVTGSCESSFFSAGMWPFTSLGPSGSLTD